MYTNMVNTTKNTNCSGMAFPVNDSCLQIIDGENLLTTSDIIGLTVFNCVSIFPGTVGNILVLLAICLNTSLQTVPDLFIASLACADLFVTMIRQPLGLVRIHNHEGINSALQNALSNMGNISLTASILGMFAVTIDRCIAIRRPFQYNLIATKTKALVGIAVVWTVSMLLGFSEYLIGGKNTRFILWGLFSISLITIAIIYLYIFIIASKQENRIVNVQAREHGQDQQINHNRMSNQIRERKAAKTIAIVVGVFVMFWIPFLCYTISNTSKSVTAEFFRGFYWVISLSMCNSAINPYIYCARNRRYRMAFWKLLGKKVNIDA